MRQQITVALTNQRKEILNAALLEVSLTEAKVVNNFAANILNNPSNLGFLRPAATQSPAAAGNSPAPAATTAAPPAAKPSAAATKK